MQLFLYFYPPHKLLKLLLCRSQSRFFMPHRGLGQFPHTRQVSISPGSVRAIFKNSTLKKPQKTLKSENPSLCYVAKPLLLDFVNPQDNLISFVKSSLQYGDTSKIKNRSAFWPSDPISGDISKETQNTNLKEHKHPCVYCSIIYNRQDMKVSQVPISR